MDWRRLGMREGGGKKEEETVIEPPLLRFPPIFLFLSCVRVLSGKEEEMAFAPSSPVCWTNERDCSGRGAAFLGRVYHMILTHSEFPTKNCF